MSERTYTADEANEALPRVRTLVERIVEIVPGLPDMEENVRIQALKSRREGASDDAQEELARSVAALRAAEMAVAVAARSLEEMNVLLKDAGIGLVDFPCYRDGELVELCWRLGEPSVASWHRVGEGFAGRRPL